jgi:WD40 repeat protein
VQVLTGHSGSVNTLCYLKDFKLASGADDANVKIWNYENDSLLKNLTGHTKPIQDLLALDNEILLSCSKDQTINVWHLGTYSLVTSLTEFDYPIDQILLLNNNQQTFASSSFDGPIIIWNYPSGQTRHLLFGHTDFVLSVVFLKSFYLASSGFDRSVIIWNYETGEEVRTIETVSYVISLSLLNNGHLAVAIDVSCIQIWNYTSGLLVDTFYKNALHLCLLKMGNLAYATFDNKIEVIYSLNAYNYTSSKPKNRSKSLF